jgi:hypothetical protein
MSENIANSKRTGRRPVSSGIQIPDGYVEAKRLTMDRGGLNRHAK